MAQNDKPQRRTYTGGETLPTLTDKLQDVRLGRDADGELVPEQRAFVATVRNRSGRSDMYIQEGSGDEVRIAPGETYPVTRVDGMSRLRLRGLGVGDEYDIVTVEAHNDFGIIDRVEAFAQSIGALIGSSASNRPQDSAVRGDSKQWIWSGGAGSVDAGNSEFIDEWVNNTGSVVYLAEVSVEWDAWNDANGWGVQVNTQGDLLDIKWALDMNVEEIHLQPRPMPPVTTSDEVNVRAANRSGISTVNIETDLMFLER